MIRELRFAIRMLLRQPGFSIIAVLTLALGIGATSAVFSLIQGVLLTPPPYRDPGRLALIPASRSDGQPLTNPRGWPAAQWQEWQKEAKSFESVAAYGWTFNFLVDLAGSESLQGMSVTKDYFRVVGLEPALGRTFSDSEVAPNAAPVVVIGYDLWQRRFNRDPNVLGKPLRMSRRETPPQIIGVMPPGVRFLPSPGASKEPNYNVDAQVDFWSPAAPRQDSLKSPGWEVVGRLRPGATLQQAQSELTVLTRREAAADRDFEGFAPRIELLRDEMNREGRGILLPLLGAAALVLLIACGNAAALLLVRGLQRQQEYAVRTALGIARIALFRQIAVESLMLAFFGGALGVGIAFGVVRIFKSIGSHAIPRLDAVQMGWPILAWGLGSALLAALLAGIIPAFRASSLDPVRVLNSAGPKSSAGRGERRLLRLVTMAQTALTLALMVGAGLLIRTMVNLSQVHSGYQTDHILTMSVTSVQGDWSDFHHRALDRVSALPGVSGAAFAWGVPLTGNNWPGTLDIEGRAVATKESDKVSLPLRAVTPGYFALLGLSISQGRDFRSTDQSQPGVQRPPDVAIVNQAFADRFFDKANPVGRKLWIFHQHKVPTEIVGLVTNGRTDDLTKAAEPEVYLSLWQASAFSKHLLVRTPADPRAIVASVRRELHSVNPSVAVENVKTLDQIRDESQASRAFAMQLLVGFSIIGSVLTVVGIYGVLSLSIASRRRELAIRAAVGAAQWDIRKIVFAEGFRLTFGGVLVGIAGALILSRVLQSFLFGVDPADPLTLIGVGLLFTVVACLACWAPGRRAARVNPVEALRGD